MTTANWSQRLEQYTALTPQEALLVDFTVDGEPDRVVIFRGFSSSLMRATAFDPDVPVLPETAMIARIERVVAPYDPAARKSLRRSRWLKWLPYWRTRG